SDCGEPPDGADIVRRGVGRGAMPQRVIDHHQPEGLAAGHAELFLVDAFEGEALVEFEGTLKVTAELAPADGQHAHLEAPTRLEAGDQPRQAAPATLELEQPRGPQVPRAPPARAA